MIIEMMLNPILSAAAIIPAVYLLVKIYQLDRLEKEPTKLLVWLVILGIISTGFAIVTEIIGSSLVGVVFREGSLFYRILENFLVVALSEEGFKYLLMKKKTWKNPNFNCSFDAVVYATFVSLGFALAENVGYVLQNGFSVAILRAVTAIPGHACFGVLMGAYYGVAKRYANQGMEESSKVFRQKAVWVPVMAHGAYDFIASSGSTLSGIIFFVFVGALFTRVLKLIKGLSAEDTFLTEAPEDVQI